MADQGYELALQLVQALQPGEVRGGCLIGGVLGVHVLVHDEEVLDLAQPVADRGRAPVEPHLGVVGADRPGLGLDAVDVAPPQWLKDREDALELVRVQVPGDGRADHLLWERPQQRGHPGVYIDDAHVDSRPRDAQRGVRDDLVEQGVAARHLALRVAALVQQVQRVPVRQHLVGDEQDAEPAREHGLELVEGPAVDREVHDGERAGEHRHPG